MARGPVALQPAADPLETDSPSIPDAATMRILVAFVRQDFVAKVDWLDLETGIRGDPVLGMSFIDCLELFKKDKETEACLLIGEIGGSQEEEAAAYIQKQFKK